jgi:hypothetical protein
MTHWQSNRHLISLRNHKKKTDESGLSPVHRRPEASADFG